MQPQDENASQRSNATNKLKGFTHVMVVIVVLFNALESIPKSLHSFVPATDMARQSLKPFRNASVEKTNPQNSDKHRLHTVLTELQNTATRYYVYDHPNLTLSNVRKTALDPKSIPIRRATWTRRFQSYARGEAQVLQALDDHPLRLRGDDSQKQELLDQSAFVIVPIPFCGVFMFEDPLQSLYALQHLLQNEPYYAQHPEKHVFVTTFEYFFRSNKLAFTKGFGYNKRNWHSFEKSMVVKDLDSRAWATYLSTPAGQSSDWSNEGKNTQPILFRQSWSLGFIQEANVPAEYEWRMQHLINVTAWQQKRNHVFYHTVNASSLNNSTIYRHAPVHAANQFPQPSSIGFPIPQDLWLENFRQSKFCLVIRGDNPTTRSFFRAISVGCMPVIVSDTLQFYSPVYRSILHFQDYAIVISEADFLLDPAGSLQRAIEKLTEEQLQLKVDYLAALQRILMIDHTSSLFVPAFVRETIAAQAWEYNQYPPSNMTKITTLG